MLTRTLAVPAVPAGVTAVIEVGLTTKAVATAPPMVTTEAPVKLAPVIVIAVPPVTGPLLGLIEVMVGGGVP